MFNIGDEVIINIPNPIPKPYDVFSPKWHSWIQSLRGLKLTITDTNINMGSSTIKSTLVGCKVDVKQNSFASNWIPNEWLVPYKKMGTFTVNPCAGYDSGGDNIIVKNLCPRVGYCVSCGGVGKHRLMCPVAKSVRA